MTIEELEKKVWDQDHIRIIVRDRSNATVKEYNQKRAAQDNWRITQFLKNRIAPLIKDREAAVIDGDGKIPHGNIKLNTIRQSYNGNGSKKS
jgi:hypothetical protein